LAIQIAQSLGGGVCVPQAERTATTSAVFVIKPDDATPLQRSFAEVAEALYF
jgi:hypothetical protein